MDTTTIISIISTMSSSLAVLVALLAILIQARQNNLALKASILRSIYEEFYNSENIRNSRLEVSRFLLKRKNGEPPPPVVADLLDFFDVTGLYLKQGIIDSEMTWSMLYYWLSHYWKLLEKDAEFYERISSGTAYYGNLRFLHDELSKIARRKKRLPSSDYFSESNIRFFLEEEIKTCTIKGKTKKKV
jgi:hypothetical protein